MRTPHPGSMNTLCNHLFSSTGFSIDHHSGICIGNHRNLLLYFIYLLRGSNYIIKMIQNIRLLFHFWQVNVSTLNILVTTIVNTPGKINSAYNLAALHNGQRTADVCNAISMSCSQVLHPVIDGLPCLQHLHNCTVLLG